MLKRRYAREIILKILYQKEMSGYPLEQIVQNTLESDKVSPKMKEYILHLSGGTLENLESIDKILTDLAIKWKLGRMGAIDRNILRLALFELTYEKDTPSKVIVNEAIEIAKKYGDIHSYQFINGILDSAIKLIRKENSDTSEMNK